MIPTHTLLNMLRNPYGRSDDEMRSARLQAADMLEAAEAAKPITGTLDYEPWASKESLAVAACKLLRESGVPMRDPDDHNRGHASGTLEWFFDTGRFKASFRWVP